MTDLLFRMLLGHFVGDYLLQNNWMALNKNKHRGLGWITCIVHCSLYTLAVCLLMWLWSWQWIVIVFLSHFIIDKFGLAERYLQLIRGRSLEKFMNFDENPPGREEYFRWNRRQILRGGFNILVYTVVDNTMHLLLMYFGLKIICQI